jgi:hypothetical protein
VDAPSARGAALLDALLATRYARREFESALGAPPGEAATAREPELERAFECRCVGEAAPRAAAVAARAEQVAALLAPLPEGVRDIFAHDYVEEVAGVIVGAARAASFVARVAHLTRHQIC